MPVVAEATLATGKSRRTPRGLWLLLVPPLLMLAVVAGAFVRPLEIPFGPYLLGASGEVETRAAWGCTEMPQGVPAQVAGSAGPPASYTPMAPDGSLRLTPVPGSGGQEFTFAALYTLTGPGRSWLFSSPAGSFRLGWYRGYRFRPATPRLQSGK
jgi:hypothetical protein